MRVSDLGRRVAAPGRPQECEERLGIPRERTARGGRPLGHGQIVGVRELGPHGETAAGLVGDDIESRQAELREPEVLGVPGPGRQHPDDLLARRKHGRAGHPPGLVREVSARQPQRRRLRHGALQASSLAGSRT
jgi:hypothetical protein